MICKCVVNETAWCVVNIYRRVWSGRVKCSKCVNPSNSLTLYINTIVAGLSAFRLPMVTTTLPFFGAKTARVMQTILYHRFNTQRYLLTLCTSSLLLVILLCLPSSLGRRHYALMTIVCLSVCLSVCICPMRDPNLRTEERKKLKLGNSETQETECQL